MSKIKSLVIMALLMLTFPTLSVSADVANPEFATKHCKPGEKEITATYSNKEPFGSRISDETKKYANNPNYYELTSDDHSSGGTVTFCQTSGENTIKLIGAVVAAVVALSLAGLVWLRRRSAR